MVNPINKIKSQLNLINLTKISKSTKKNYQALSSIKNYRTQLAQKTTAIDSTIFNSLNLQTKKPNLFYNRQLIDQQNFFECATQDNMQIMKRKIISIIVKVEQFVGQFKGQIFGKSNIQKQAIKSSFSQIKNIFQGKRLFQLEIFEEQLKKLKEMLKFIQQKPSEIKVFVINKTITILKQLGLFHIFKLHQVSSINKNCQNFIQIKKYYNLALADMILNKKPNQSKIILLIISSLKSFKQNLEGDIISLMEHPYTECLFLTKLKNILRTRSKQQQNNDIKSSNAEQCQRQRQTKLRSMSEDIIQNNAQKTIQKYNLNSFKVQYNNFKECEQLQIMKNNIQKNVSKFKITQALNHDYLLGKTKKLKIQCRTQQMKKQVKYQSTVKIGDSQNPQKKKYSFSLQKKHIKQICGINLLSCQKMMQTLDNNKKQKPQLLKLIVDKPKISKSLYSSINNNYNNKSNQQYSLVNQSSKKYKKGTVKKQQKLKIK